MGTITFTEKKKQGLKPERLQSGMFMDRPDLWKRLSKRRLRSIPPEQSKMFLNPAHLYLGQPPKCKLNKKGKELKHV